MATAQPIANIFQIVLYISYFSFNSFSTVCTSFDPGPISRYNVLAYCHKLREAWESRVEASGVDFDLMLQQIASFGNGSISPQHTLSAPLSLSLSLPSLSVIYANKITKLH